MVREGSAHETYLFNRSTPMAIKYAPPDAENTIYERFCAVGECLRACEARRDNAKDRRLQLGRIRVVCEHAAPSSRYEENITAE